MSAWSVLATRPRTCGRDETLIWSEVEGNSLTIERAKHLHEKGKIFLAQRHSPNEIALVWQPRLTPPAPASEPRRYSDGQDGVRDQIRAAAEPHGSVRGWSIAHSLPTSSVANFMRGEVRSPSAALLAALAASGPRSSDQASTEIASSPMELVP
jgi:hypothetical protein